MHKSISNFSKQFLFEPSVENKTGDKKFSKFMVAGMGGSNHATELLLACNPSLDIIVHRDYGLPPIHDGALTNALVIASSYSGNTEETIDAFHAALEKKLPLAAVATGGTLLELAQKHAIPYIQLPRDPGLEPRTALGYSVIALMKLMGLEQEMQKIKNLSRDFRADLYEARGEMLAHILKNKIPVIYASRANGALAYVWKINLNETGKVPAYHNVFPELNHNELNAFDLSDSTRRLGEKFHFVLLQDTADHPRIIKRMEVTQKLYRDRGLAVEVVALDGASRMHRIFSSVVLSYWMSYYIAKQYNRSPEGVPVIEEFKKLIQ